MEIADALKQANDAVEAAGIPDDLREIAFSRALDTLLVGAPAATAVDETGDTPQPSQTSQGWVHVLVEKLQSDRSDIEDTYDLVDGELAIVFPPRKLPPGIKSGMLALVRIVVTGRVALDLEGATSTTETIRPLLEDYGKLDSKNFSTSLDDLSDDFVITKIHRTEKTVKPRRTAFPQTGELLRELLGDS